MQSALYEGRVRHRRFDDVAHAFELPLFLVYLDLAELDEVFRGRWLWSTTRPALARFRREDHLGDPRVPLDRSVRDLVEARLGRRPAGPIRLLTHLRQLGLGFNPVSFFYCFDAGGRRLEAVVAEVTNLPWRERHCYVLAAERGARGRHRFRTPKEFHVSPFMAMDLEYGWLLTEPGRSLVVRIESRRGGSRIFDAVLALHRREITGGSLARALVRYPAMTAQVIAAIHGQAFRLHRKGAPVHPHPRLRAAELPTEVAS
jgi:DUF1365 family protein